MEWKVEWKVLRNHRLHVDARHDSLRDSEVVSSDWKSYHCGHILKGGQGIGESDRSVNAFPELVVVHREKRQIAFPPDRDDFRYVLGRARALLDFDERVVVHAMRVCQNAAALDDEPGRC